MIEARLQGFNVVMTDGYRTFAEQNTLYAQGRTTPGSVVTNARGGFSNHNFGLAFDVVEIVDGVAQYNAQSYDRFKDLGISRGFKWGGNWTNPVDMPHFQNMFGHTITQLRDKINSGDVDSSGYVRFR